MSYNCLRTLILGSTKDNVYQTKTNIMPKNISCAMIQNSYPPKHFMLLQSVFFRNCVKKYDISGKQCFM